MRRGSPATRACTEHEQAQQQDVLTADRDAGGQGRCARTPSASPRRSPRPGRAPCREQRGLAARQARAERRRRARSSGVETALEPAAARSGHLPARDEQGRVRAAPALIGVRAPEREHAPAHAEHVAHRRDRTGSVASSGRDRAPCIASRGGGGGNGPVGGRRATGRPPARPPPGRRAPRRRCSGRRRPRRGSAPAPPPSRSPACGSARAGRPRLRAPIPSPRQVRPGPSAALRASASAAPARTATAAATATGAGRANDAMAPATGNTNTEAWVPASSPATAARRTQCRGWRRTVARAATNAAEARRSRGGAPRA